MNATLPISQIAFPKLTPEREAELLRRQQESERMISEEALRTWLKQATPDQIQ